MTNTIQQPPTTTTAKQEEKQYVNVEAVHVALSMCCGMDGRYYLRRPFLRGASVYATNGIIIAQVPSWAAPEVREVEYTPDTSNMPWDSALYAADFTPWPDFPKIKVEKCGTCFENARKDCPPSVWEMTERESPFLPCPKCGMYVCEEAPNHITMGRCVFNTRVVRRLASIGAMMFQPRKDDGVHPWRWTIPELFMVGLVMPVTTEAKFYHKDKAE